MESHKRPHEGEGGPVAIKKRALTSPNGTPLANGVAETEEPIDRDNLELFRKEAIYRRMRHYSSECERNKIRIRDLEQRKNTCEAGLAAMTACWTQLLETIRLLAEPQDLPEALTDELFNLSSHISEDTLPELRAAMEKAVYSSRDIVTKFVQLGIRSGLQADALARCQTAQTECISLRSQLSITRIRLRDSESREEELHSSLVTAQNTAQRLQSSTILAMQTRPQVTEHDPKAVEGAPESEEIRPKTPPQTQLNGGVQKSATPEVEDLWQSLALEREHKIKKLEEEHTRLQDTISNLTLEVSSPSKGTVTNSPDYKRLFDHVSYLEQTAIENRDRITKLGAEVMDLTSKRAECEESSTRDAAREIQELKILLSKRDAETSRLRDQRDQQASEILERKQRETVKLQSLQQWKDLAETRSERIAVLEAELKRLKAHLAAKAGDESLAAYLLGDNPDSVSYIDDLKNRLASAEARADALVKSFANFNEEHPDVVTHMRAETEVRQQLASTTAQLAKYQTIYGDPSTLPPDLQNLEAQLRVKSDEISRLQLLESQHAETEASLCSEIDKLSAAWEALDRQVKNKVFDLSVMEERLTKTGHDRAKLENRYYAAMRDKEAMDLERKNAARSIEKQAKVIERLVETERSLSAQVADLEKEITALKIKLDAHQVNHQERETEVKEWKTRAESEKGRFDKIRIQLQSRERAHEGTRVDLRKAEEALARVKTELEKQMSKLKAIMEAGGSRSGADQVDFDRYMTIFRCSVCKNHLRNTVVTKCMHTFCKGCIDARIATRQRKCPACSNMFALSEVQPIYFQG